MKTPLIVVSAPSGAGKSSFCKKALEDFKELTYSISYTTRPPREGEVEGNPYHFVDRKKFLELKDQGFFIETAEVFNNLYGTPKNEVERAKKLGKFLIMDIDVQGADSFRRYFPDATYIFILPPSVDELRRRLMLRDKGKTQNLEIRLKKATDEMNQAPRFNHQVLNDDFNSAYAQFKKIIEELIKSR
ncbi:MAG TPA: guanylate kinase [Bdellovibrionales bacterium]|nr:guanylate kinase [Bdellovibrionales bacterium]